VNDFAIARAGAYANRVGCFKHHPLFGVIGRSKYQGARNGQAHHTCTNDQTINFVQRQPLRKIKGLI
jgi:hypothetical protein